MIFGSGNLIHCAIYRQNSLIKLFNEVENGNLYHSNRFKKRMLLVIKVKIKE